MTARRDQVQPLLAELQRVAAAAQSGAELPVRAVLDGYIQAVAELRAVALEARARIERSAVVIAEAREFVRRGRRRR